MLADYVKKGRIQSAKNPLLRLVYGAICDHWRDHGREPSMGEVAEVLMVESRSTIHHIVKRLRNRGLIAEGTMTPCCLIPHIKRHRFREYA